MAVTVDDRPIPVADVGLRPIRYGPWKGSMRSVPSDRVPPEFLAESDSDTPSSNYHFLPRYGTWKRRLGQTQKFDTFGASIGLLSAKWSSKGRQLEEFISDDITSGVPTLIALATKETVAAGLDDGKFSNVYVRDQTNDLNYTVGSEYSSTTYPTPGTEASLKFIPLWHYSGDGGITHGIDEFTRRLFFSGSRKMAKVGNWHYFPSLLGTPSRWLPAVTAAEGTAITATGDGTGWALQSSGGAPFKWAIADLTGTFLTTAWQDLAVDNSPSDADFVFINNASASTTLPATGNLTFPALSAGLTHFTIRMKVKLTVAWAGSHTVQVDVVLADTNRYRQTHTVSTTSTPGSWVTLDLDYSTATDLVGTGTANTVQLLFSAGGGVDFTPGFYINYLAFVPVASSSTNANRLIPSGPIPPTHAGTLRKGNATSGASAAIFERPDADDTDAGWVNSVGNGTDLFSYIDEATVDDTDYIKSPANSSTNCLLRLSDFSQTPATGDTVTLNIRAKFQGFPFPAFPQFGAAIYEGGVSKGGSNFTLTTSFANYSYTFTAAQVAAVTDWTSLKLNIASITGVNINIYVSQAYLSLTTGPSEGAWQGSDRFFYGMAYRFEDDSIWMPTLPRFANDLLTSGWNLFTVDAANPTTNYDSVVWENMPIPPKGIKSKFPLRTDKIDSTLTDSLALNQFGFRIITEIDAATTTYVDQFADDDSLQLDPDALLIRYDHIMPPRARYIFTGDMRICHSYGGVNPCAIEIAPIGRVNDYDLNLADNSSTLYTYDASFMQISRDSSGNGTLTLTQTDGTTASATLSLPFTGTTGFLTLQRLVDRINATSCAADGQQWRAQLCPGVNPEAPTNTCLTPHARAIDSCVTVSGTKALTKAAGGLSAIPIGSRVGMTNVTVGTYIVAIVSDTELTMSANATGSGTNNAVFYQWQGDAPTVATTNIGYQRVISNSLPGFLYFTRAYLDQFPVEKSSIWMTTSSPGSNKSAANCFSGKLSNKFFPPTLNAGKCMGGVGIENGFFVPFEKQRAVIRNLRDTGSGIDEEYRLYISNEFSGCASWQSVTGGAGFGICAAPEGIVASTLTREMLLSEAIWAHPRSDTATGVGDFSYEMPTSIASTAADTDNAYLICRVLRNVLYVNYRTSASTTHPNRQIAYDFSSGTETYGLEALKRTATEMWGWSVPLVRSVTAIAEGRRTDGSHLYAWNDANAGSTGDGRIDEFETSETDNGTAISGSITTPWLRPGSRKLTFHRFVAEHSTPSGATAVFDFHRSLSDETYSLTPTTSSSLPYVRDWKELTLPARAPTAAGFFGFRQSAGSAQEIRSLEVYVEELDTYA